MKGKVFVVLLALAILATALFAETTTIPTSPACSSASTFTENDWKSLAVIGLTISAVLIGLFFMAGKVLENAALITRAKGDAQQLLVTTLILIIFTSFVITICSIDATQFGLKQSTIFDSARAYFTYAQSKAVAAYAQGAKLVMTAAGLSTIYTSGSLEPAWEWLSYSTSPLTGLNVILGPLNFVMHFSVLNIAVASSQIFILDAIELSFLSLLLPLGIVCRCFSPFREFGGILIGLAIGLYLIYPLMFAISYLMLDQPPAHDIPDTTWEPTVFQCAFWISVTNLVPYTMPFVQLIANAYADTLITQTKDFLTELGSALLVIYVLPAINWIIIGVAVRDISRALGEEVDISTLGRMI